MRHSQQACLISEWFKDLFLFISCHVGFGVAFATGTVTLNIKKFLNLRYIMPDGEIFILIKQKHSHRISCKIFLLNYMVKSLKKYPWENSFWENCRLQTDCWRLDPFSDIFQKFVLKLGTYFKEHLIFRSPNLKSGWFLYCLDKEYLLWNFIHLWRKVEFSEKKFLIGIGVLFVFHVSGKNFLSKIANFSQNLLCRRWLTSCKTSFDRKSQCF